MSKLIGLAIFSALTITSNAANAGIRYEYAGQFAVADGPLWTTNPATYSAQEAAALIFGGAPLSYAISTNSSRNSSSITFSSYVDGWGVNASGGPRIQTTQNFKAGTTYNERPGVVGSAYSAYVFDHACGRFYCAPGGGENAINYAWKIVKTPELSDEALSVINTLLGAVQSTAEAWIKTIQDYKGGAGLQSLRNFLVNIEPSVGGAFSRIGGVAINGLQGLLDPAVATGVKAIYDQLKDPERILNGGERNALRLLECAENPTGCNAQPKPLMPIEKNGNTSIFKTFVNENDVLVLDPEIATGFEYSSLEGGPRFKSVITPYLGEFQDDYGIQVKQNNDWITIGRSTPLNEFFFETPVDAFRIVDILSTSNIDPALHPTWVAGVSFDSAGPFTGRMLALTNSVNEVPEPSSLALVGIAVVAMFSLRLRNKKTYLIYP